MLIFAQVVVSRIIGCLSVPWQPTLITPGWGQRSQGAWQNQAVIKGAARKDNIPYDIPVPWPVLITPPSSPGFFILPDGTENTADCRNGCVTSVM